MPCDLGTRSQYNTGLGVLAVADASFTSCAHLCQYTLCHWGAVVVDGGVYQTTLVGGVFQCAKRHSCLLDLRYLGLEQSDHGLKLCLRPGGIYDRFVI